MNEHRVEIRNLNERYESQIAEANNEYKAELRKLNSRVEILAKEKELQKEKYESQIAELDSTIRGLESKRSDLTLELPYILKLTPRTPRLCRRVRYMQFFAMRSFQSICMMN